MKATERTAQSDVQEWDGGITWIAHPDEGMKRASHALATDDGVWIVDPVDTEGIDDRIDDLGEAAGVAVLLDRHTRDADAFARRHDVAVHVPEWMDGVEEDLEAPVEDLGDSLNESEYGLHRLVDNRFWQEAALYGENSATLVVPEAVGTAAFFLAGSERLGVHPMVRLTPPRKLRRFAPQRVLVGHGQGIHEDAGTAITDALSGSRRNAPALYVRTLRDRIFR